MRPVDMSRFYSSICTSLGRGILLCAIVTLPSTTARARQPGFSDTAAVYFGEIRAATAQNRDLWNLDLYGPILLVERESRNVYASLADSAGTLNPEGSVYTGVLPKTVNISNTSLRWGGREWAMIMLPLPAGKSARLNLLAHELFHRSQSALGFTNRNPDNNHLDRKDGRVYIRLELEALKQALLAGSADDLHEHVANALAFRQFRRVLFQGADTTENQMELNEGMTEFTGVMLSGRSDREVRDHFMKSIGDFLVDRSYVRAFAYETIPVYGYLLAGTNPGWNREIGGNTDLTAYFEKAFGISLPPDLKRAMAGIGEKYHSKIIVDEETERDTRLQKQIAEYKSRFIEKQHLEIPLQNMNMSFDYKLIVPLEDKGTVYPTIRVVDNWGILTVNNGALMSPGWDKITVSVPAELGEKFLKGDGWTLELKENYHVVGDRQGGNYVLKKK